LLGLLQQNVTMKRAAIGWSATLSVGKTISS
jgi:hypothetical protein